ncbi:hypothetical protein BSKO_09295 [Bryopsis sp. KO-2023]|nr:hypothetical protein BSKO_09295 [Bryopsis sp. KO-2023]
MSVEENGGSGCFYNYVVTAQKPMGVTHSVVGNFTSPTDVNLIIGKFSRIEIHKLQREGLHGMLDVPIYDRIAALTLFRPKGDATDSLMLLTERNRLCILQYDSVQGELVTKASGDVMDKIGTHAKHGSVGIVDPECRMIGLHLYNGLFKAIPMIGSQVQEAFNIRLEELNILDMCFLHKCSKPTLALLYEDTKLARHLRTYEVNLKEKDLMDEPWKQMNIDTGAEHLIPVKGLGGVIVLGETMVTYYSSKQPHVTAPVQETTFRAHGCIDEDGSRYLLGDCLGNLFLLVLANDGDNVIGLRVQKLGRIPAPSSLSYLDSGVVFVGSRVGDSQLVRLQDTPVPPTNDCFLEVLLSFTNVGPIVDFCVMDLDRQGQCQVVTCSGAFLEGSLRIVRNGIGITEQATIELPGIKGLWSLKKSISDEFDTFLVLSFVNETRILAVNEEDEVEEATIDGFDGEAQTLHSSNLIGSHMLQVTSSQVLVVSSMDLALKGSWQPADGYSINVASSSPSQVFLAGGQGGCVYLKIRENGEVDVAGTCKMESEVSCVDITPIGSDTNEASIAAVGTWDMNLSLFALPSLSPIAKMQLSSEVIPRSILFASFEGSAFLLCAMGDGGMYSWRVDPESGALADKKKMSLGTKPVTLRRFWTNGTSHVFAASDRPTVIYGANKKLLYSNLNEDDVNFLGSFNSASFPDSLALAKEGSLTIGSIDEIQKLHIRSVPLGEQPRRICHQPETKSLGVLVCGIGERPQNSLRIFNQETFEVMDTLPLDTNEEGLSILSTSFANDPNVYFVVGTAYVVPSEEDPTRGRILVIHFIKGKAVVVAEREVMGATFTLNEMQGRLLTSVNCKVHIMEWRTTEDFQKELVTTCTNHGHIMALYVAARGDFIIVGDLMRSMVLLLYKPAECQLEERARHYPPNWMTAVTVLDDDVFLGAENNCNIFTVKRNSDSAVEEEQARLSTVGEFHIADVINQFRHGSLVMRSADSEFGKVPTVLFATVGGMLGVIASLPQKLYLHLEKVEEAMRKVVKGVGGLSHKQHRRFTNERRNVEAHNFVDGDLIEAFLDLNREKMDEVAALVDVPTEDLCKTIEELSRLH